MGWLVMASGSAREKPNQTKFVSSSDEGGVATRTGSRSEEKPDREKLEYKWYYKWCVVRRTQHRHTPPTSFHNTCEIVGSGYIYVAGKNRTLPTGEVPQQVGPLQARLSRAMDLHATVIRVSKHGVWRVKTRCAALSWGH